MATLSTVKAAAILTEQCHLEERMVISDIQSGFRFYIGFGQCLHVDSNDPDIKDVVRIKRDIKNKEVKNTFKRCQRLKSSSCHSSLGNKTD